MEAVLRGAFFAKARPRLNDQNFMSLVGRSSGVRFIHVFIILSLSPSYRYVSCSIPDAVSNFLCRVEWEYDFERLVSPPEGFDPRTEVHPIRYVS